MKLTITTLTDEIFNLEVSDDMELENVKALCEFECGIPSAEIQLLWNGRPLADGKKRLAEYGVADGDILLLQRIQGALGQQSMGAPPRPNPASSGLPVIDFGSIQMPGMGAGILGGASTSSGRPQAGGGGGGGGGLPEDPASVRELLLNSPHDLALLKERNPPLADALLSGDLEKFSTVLRRQQQERADKERQRISLLNADQFDPSIQQQIQEEIRLKNVESNMEAAMEHAPESFGQVVMLYIDCRVNGHHVKAFVDSGAQMTIMSQRCAERCGIMRLVDTRWAGIAKGVGTQKIIGRVHLCPLQIEKDFLQTSFSILEEQPMDMLLGLDMLKRHQCTLDLRNNKLVIGTTGTETKFLGEGDVPEHARLNKTSADMEVDEDKQLAEALTRSAQDSAAASGAGPSTSAASPAPASPAPASSGSAPSPFPESDITKLTSQGFPRQQAIDELTKANGNVDQALVSLLAKSFQLP